MVVSGIIKAFIFKDMARLTQAEIRSLADEWAGLNKKIGKATNAMGAELDPYIREHNEAIKPVLGKWEPKIAKLETMRDEIADTVTNWLREYGKPVSIESNAAVAANHLKASGRVIDAETFFNKIKDRSAAFWGCVTIAIQKADKYLGKTLVDEIATTKTGLTSTLKLKD